VDGVLLYFILFRGFLIHIGISMEWTMFWVAFLNFFAIFALFGVFCVRPALGKLAFVVLVLVIVAIPLLEWQRRLNSLN
jgi:hypothetical protein